MIGCPNFKFYNFKLGTELIVQISLSYRNQTDLYKSLFLGKIFIIPIASILAPKIHLQQTL